MQNPPSFLEVSGRRFRKLLRLLREYILGLRLANLNMNRRHSIEGVLKSVKAVGFVPGTVIDIGVYMGTEGLYNVWPNSTICLVEPMPGNKIYLEQIAKKYPSVIPLNVAASNEAGEKEIRIKSIGAGVIDDVQVDTNADSRGKVKTITLDQIIDEYSLTPPYVLKIDTDGHEREILEGAKNCLKQTEICILEADKFADYKNKRITVSEIFNIMDQYDLVFFDFAGRSYGINPDITALRIVDLVFARRKGFVFEKTFQLGADKGDKTIRRLLQRALAKLRNPHIGSILSMILLIVINK
jgi:FkbM family methyltransferase